MKKTLVALGLMIAMIIGTQATFASCPYHHHKHMKKVHHARYMSPCVSPACPISPCCQMVQPCSCLPAFPLPPARTVSTAPCGCQSPCVSPACPCACPCSSPCASPCVRPACPCASPACPISEPCPCPAAPSCNDCCD